MPNQYNSVKAQRLNRIRQYLYKYLDSFEGTGVKVFRAAAPDILEAIRYLLIVENIYHRTYKSVKDFAPPSKQNIAPEDRRERELDALQSKVDNIPIELLIEQARQEALKRAEKQNIEPIDEGHEADEV